MAKNKNEVKKLIDNFAKELKKEITVKEIILFGSYAAGKPTVNSD